MVVLLISVGLSGCIEENKPPKAEFTTSIIDTDSFDIRGVQFSDNSSDQDGEIVKWHWDFGDEDISDDQNPIHNFTSGGHYEVIGYIGDDEILKGPLFNITLTVTDNKNSINSVTKTVWAQPYLPLVPINITANFTYSPTESITNETIITFNATTSATNLNVTYYWNFGDGVNVTEFDNITTHKYATAGEYTVNLTVYDELLNSASVLKNITVS